MALKDIFTMVKADRYTQDGREEIIKAQETEVEDRTYNIGEISQKTGLMKTANGWVEPPKGKAKGAKTGAGKSSKNTDYSKMDGEELSDLIKEQTSKVKELEEKGRTEKNGFRRQFIAHEYAEEKAKLDQMNRALDTPAKSPDKKAAKTESKQVENKTTVRQGTNTKTLNESPAEHIKKNWDAYDKYSQSDMENLVLRPSGYEETDSYSVMGGGKRVQYSKEGVEDIVLFYDKDGELDDYEISKKTESKPSAPKALKLPDEKSSFQTDVNRMKKLKKEDYKQYTVQLEKLHSKYPINKWKDLLDKTTSDSAPRVLTGDCKIRLKK